MEEIVRIGTRTVGPGHPAFITAEIGINHNGDVNLALEMIHAAAYAGVDAIKFQAFCADSFVSKKTTKSRHQQRTLDEDESTYSMWKRLEFSQEEFERFKKETENLGLVFLSSALDVESLQMLQRLNLPAYKIASGDITYLSFIRRVSGANKPVVLSVGMATLGEIEEALGIVYSTENRQVILLQCTAQYPARVSDSNLLKMKRLCDVFGIPVGLSDHTTSMWTPAAAAALGACFIERHFTLDRSLPGTDQAMSTTPEEMKKIVMGVRDTETALGSGRIGPTESEKEGRSLFRRSLIAAVQIPEGTTITEDMITVKRPAMGIPPRYLKMVIGRTARKDIPADEFISWDAV